MVTLQSDLGHLVGDQGESVSATLGFRKIEIVNRKLLINGKASLIKGVNYHDHSDTTGKYIPPELFEKDIQVMKQFNRYYHARPGHGIVRTRYIGAIPDSW